ncbi:MAG: hypothetical protein R2857_09305 [Vampirovibrionales bacterium]
MGGTPDDPLLEFVQLLMTNQSDLFNGQRPITRQTLLDKMNRDGNRDTLSMMTFNYRSWSSAPWARTNPVASENTERYDDGLRRQANARPIIGSRSIKRPPHN